MKPKILNFIEAGNLYNLLSKYEVSNFDNLSPFQFVERLLEIVIPEDYLKFLRILFGQEVQIISLETLVESVSINNIKLLKETFGKLNVK